jgi:hypothetical protein
MTRFAVRTLPAALALTLALTLASASRAAEADPTIERIVDILRDKDLIDEATRASLLEEHAARSKAVSAAPAASGWQWKGDLRLRYQPELFDRDGTGNESDDRYRFRYRARIGVTRSITDRIAVAFGLASGTGDQRSTNQSFGESPDFQPDPIFIDYASLEWKIPGPDRLQNALLLGKMNNPLRWSQTPDALHFDPDIAVEGGALRSSFELDESTTLFSRVGGFVIQERSTTADPKLFSVQLGGSNRFSGDNELGVRFSLFEFRSLDGAFITRAMTNGNLANGFDSRARIGDFTGYVKFGVGDAGPVKLWGSLTRNFTADEALINGFLVDEEDFAWGTGIDIGDPDRWVQLGLAYYDIEANAVVANFTDSDIVNGATNARGFVVTLRRDLLEGVEMRLTYFDHDSKKNTGGAAGPFAMSVRDRDRKRLNADLVFSF